MSEENKTPEIKKTDSKWNGKRVASLFCLGIFCFVCGFFGGIAGNYSDIGTKTSSGKDIATVQPEEENPFDTVPEEKGEENGSTEEPAETDKAALGLTVRYVSNTEGYTDGVYIAAISDLSNADEAGLKVGDRIVSVDGNEVKENSDLATYVQSKTIGDTVELVAERNEDKITAKVELVSYQKMKTQASSQKA